MIDHLDVIVKDQDEKVLNQEVESINNATGMTDLTARLEGDIKSVKKEMKGHQLR